MPTMKEKMSEYDSYSLVCYDRKGKAVCGGSYPDLATATANIPIIAKGALHYDITGWKDNKEEDITTRFSSYLNHLDNDPMNV